MSSTKQFTLPEYQRLMKRLVQERGFDKETGSEVFMLLVEEVGELAKAIRKINCQKTSDDSKIHIEPISYLSLEFEGKTDEGDGRLIAPRRIFRYGSK